MLRRLLLVGGGRGMSVVVDGAHNSQQVSISGGRGRERDEGKRMSDLQRDGRS